MVKRNQNLEGASSRALPRWALRYCKPVQLQELEARIEAFEKKFGVEVVTVLAQRSSAISHVFWITLLGLWCVGLSLEYFFHAALWLHTLGVAFCIPLAWALSRLEFVQRFLTADLDEQTQVLWVAEHHFLTSGFQDSGRPVILLMVSLMEHQTVILTDPRLRELFRQSGLDGARLKEILDHCVSLVVQKSRLRQPLEGFQSALERLERDLGAALLHGREPHSQNALCNGLRFYPAAAQAGPSRSRILR